MAALSVMRRYRSKVRADMRDKTLLHEYARLWQLPEWKNRIALTSVVDNTSLTYPDLFLRVSKMAGGLRAKGVCSGQLVAVAMERSVDAVVATLSIMVAGGCPCPLEPRLTAGEITERLSSVGIAMVLADSENLAMLQDLKGIGILSTAEVACSTPYWSDDIRPEAPGLLLFTSGSTGRPKGVLLSHRGLVNNARGVLSVTALTAHDKLLHIMPLYHTNGLNNQLFSPFLIGAQVVLAGRFRAAELPELLETYKPSVMTGVPTMYSRMLDLEFSPASLASLRFARCGSAPITKELHLKIEAKLGCPLVVSYGLSEATCTSTLNPPHKRKVGSIGKALPFQRVFLRSVEGREVTEFHTDGEICIEGDSLMLGYVGTASDGVLEPAPSTLRSGDLGRMDEDGYFYITGRLKDVIIRGGENISPTLIEQVISASPDVHSCAVVGCPDEDLGEVPVAFVVPVQAGFCNEKAIQDIVNAQLSRVYRPEQVIFLEALPENSIGKVDRKVLQTYFSSGA